MLRGTLRIVGAANVGWVEHRSAAPECNVGPAFFAG